MLLVYKNNVFNVVGGLHVVCVVLLIQSLNWEERCFLQLTAVFKNNEIIGELGYRSFYSATLSDNAY